MLLRPITIFLWNKQRKKTLHRDRREMHSMLQLYFCSPLESSVSVYSPLYNSASGKLFWLIIVMFMSSVYYYAWL